LLYRAQAADTTWLELDGLLGHYQEESTQQQDVEIRQANLDGKGQPEVLVIFTSADYGSGGGFNYTSIYLLDVTAYPPRLLLRAKTGFVLEAFQGYAAMHGDTLADDEVYTGYERTVRLRPRELVLGPIKSRVHYVCVQFSSPRWPSRSPPAPRRKPRPIAPLSCCTSSRSASGRKPTASPHAHRAGPHLRRRFQVRGPGLAGGAAGATGPHARRRAAAAGREGPDLALQQHQRHGAPGGRWAGPHPRR
nr:hypothetical protein [Tanacetum cinerariifolium]